METTTENTAARFVVVFTKRCSYCGGIVELTIAIK